MDELLASGALTDLTQPVDDIQAQLDKASTTSTVDAELAALKAEVGTGAPPAPAARPGSGATADGVGRVPGGPIVIVRILGEGQYVVPDDAGRDSGDPLDDALIAAVDAGDEDGFADALTAVAAEVRSGGPAGARRRLRPLGPGRPVRRRHPGRDQAAPRRSVRPVPRTGRRRRGIMVGRPPNAPRPHEHEPPHTPRPRPDRADVHDRPDAGHPVRGGDRAADRLRHLLRGRAGVRRASSSSSSTGSPTRSPCSAWAATSSPPSRPPSCTASSTACAPWPT